MKARKFHKGFTLVEILIVVVILGILAAIVIPQFTNASETAKASSLVSQLQTIRSQLELYQVQHNGNYPDLGANWNQFTQTTDVDGGTSGTDFGPYMQQAPSNPFISAAGDANIAVNQAGTVEPGGTAAAPGYTADGWAYSVDTGELKANIPETVDAASLGLDNASDFNVESGSGS